MIKKSSDPNKVLMDYRNTPLECIGLSPAQLHIGRHNLNNQRQGKQGKYYNQHCGKKALSQLKDGKM